MNARKVLRPEGPYDSGIFFLEKPVLFMEKEKTGMKQKMTTKNMIMAAFFLAAGIVLPFFTGQIPAVGSMLLPMHIPVLICGYVCGWPWGLLVGIVLPLLRSAMFGMPPMMPTAAAMAFELAAYGAVTGLLYERLEKNMGSLYISLIGAMIAGRVVWGAVSMFLYGVMGNAFSFQIFLSGALLKAVPGIVVQLVLIPPVIAALQKAKVVKK